VEHLLAAEVGEALGRQRHERREDEGQIGYRNGYKARQLRTGEGRIEVDVPQVRGLEGPYRSQIWQGLGTRSVNLEKLVAEMYVRGLSTRDIEDLLKEISDDGQRPLLSKSTVSEVTEVLWEEYQAFTKRDLSAFDVVYLFVDAVYESLKQQANCRQAILVSWGILSDGSKVLLHMSLGNKESQSSWLEHFRSLVSRGLPSPLTITSDGAPGLIAAVEAMWPESERIRCWFHKMQNVLDKVPEAMREQIKKLLQDVRDAPDYETGKARAGKLIQEYQKPLPSAMACLADDLEASLAHLKLPSLHQKAIRTTNLAERGFVEERRRAKVIPKFRTEEECLKLVFGTLWRASERWRQVKFSALEKKQLEAYIRVRQAMGKKVREVLSAA
ncbi:MAG TPA: IS256 family transposase, partial [Chloroflexota bacterium]|nr:IS256 family transposase [Chloroflexota bacterium]